MLAKVVQVNQQDWDVYLLFAYRTPLHESMLFTPYQLVFSWSPMLPVDVKLKHPYPPQAGKEGGRVSQFVFEVMHQYFKEAYTAANSHFNLAILIGSKAMTRSNMVNPLALRIVCHCTHQ